MKMYLKITVGLPPDDDDIEVHGTYMTDGEYRMGRFHPGDVLTASEVSNAAAANERIVWRKRMQHLLAMLDPKDLEVVDKIDLIRIARGFVRSCLNDSEEAGK